MDHTDIIKAAQDENVVDVQKGINSALHQKIGDAIDARRIELQQSITQEEPASTEEE